MTKQSVRKYTVSGMTCDHCRRSVAEEVGEVAGVDAVAVDLATASLAVRGDGFTDEAIADAVAAAGYSIAR